MTLDILAFTLAAANLIAVFAMLTIGLIGMSGMPISTRCDRCSHWMFHMHGDESTCRRCRIHTAHTPRPMQHRSTTPR
ncbi:hypothetical protein [Nocardia sp. NPDC020380]|uniref:hypothetical protein n=1 Tax=Nocardia sp. NPDC020380 TaxID=3364309 RepID=UPI0037B615C2